MWLCSIWKWHFSIIQYPSFFTRQSKLLRLNLKMYIQRNNKSVFPVLVQARNDLYFSGNIFWVNGNTLLLLKLFAFSAREKDDSSLMYEAYYTRPPLPQKTCWDGGGVGWGYERGWTNDSHKELWCTRSQHFHLHTLWE